MTRRTVAVSRHRLSPALIIGALWSAVTCAPPGNTTGILLSVDASQVEYGFSAIYTLEISGQLRNQLHQFTVDVSGNDGGSTRTVGLDVSGLLSETPAEYFGLKVSARGANNQEIGSGETTGTLEDGNVVNAYVSLSGKNSNNQKGGNGGGSGGNGGGGGNIYPPPPYGGNGGGPYPPYGGNGGGGGNIYPPSGGGGGPYPPYGGNGAGGSAGGPGTSSLGQLCDAASLSCPDDATCLSLGSAQKGFCSPFCSGVGRVGDTECQAGYSGPGRPTCQTIPDGDSCFIACSIDAQPACPKGLICQQLGTGTAGGSISICLAPN